MEHRATAGDERVRGLPDRQHDLRKTGQRHIAHAAHLVSVISAQVFSGFASHGTSTWTNDTEIKAAIVPGATGFAGMVTTWKSVFTLTGKGPIADSSPPLVLIEQKGTLEQQGPDI